ncbi:MAG TPA: alpha/beta family hydrolase [Vicinamibacteria bacterium]
MEEKHLETPVGPVSLSVHGSGDRVVVLGHGAGSTRRYPALVSLAEELAASGRQAVLFNFPYSETGKRRPDAPAVLEATVRVVAEHARHSLGARCLVLGGRSMGGRIASQAVAAGLAADGLVFLAYPLHPPGRPQQLRDAHLSQIAAPMLFVQGTRDDFARPDLLEAVLKHLGDRATLHRVQDGDHSFGVLKKHGRTAEQVRAEIASALLGWLDARKL